MTEKGTVEGFTDELREICRDYCAESGEPPCWKLPDMTSDCDGTVIRPCVECLVVAGYPVTITAKEE